LAEVLLPFNRTYPDVELDLDIALTVPLVKSLLEHRLEAIVVASPATDPALTSEPVFEEEIVLISGPQADAITTPTDVASRTLLQFRHGCPYRERLERWLSLGHATPAKRLDLGAYGAILGCVAAGMGVSLLPRGMAEPLAQRGALRIHQLPGLNTATTHFMWRKHASLSSAAQDFLGELRRQSQNRRQMLPLPD
jgi:DNA-binding transcriptional LysR family regulator